MEIREITTSVSVRVNTGDYQGTEHLVSLTGHLDELDDPEEEERNLTRLAERAMMARLVRLYRVRGKKATQQEIARIHGLTYAIDGDDTDD